MRNNIFDHLLEHRSNFFDIENMQEIFLISDTHFNHDKIGEYCGRPDNWQELVISNWNKTISKNDVVLHLGDFAFGNKEEVKKVRDKLNGTIYMIKGNHDRHSVGWYRDIGIKLFKKPFVIDGIDFTPILFSHAQKPCMNEMVNIHGHQHEKVPFITNWFGNIHINMSVEQINYKPMKFKEIYNSLLLLDDVV